MSSVQHRGDLLFCAYWPFTTNLQFETFITVVTSHVDLTDILIQYIQIFKSTVLLLNSQSTHYNHDSKQQSYIWANLGAQTKAVCVCSCVHTPTYTVCDCRAAINPDLCQALRMIDINAEPVRTLLLEDIYY